MNYEKEIILVLSVLLFSSLLMGCTLFTEEYELEIGFAGEGEGIVEVDGSEYDVKEIFEEDEEIKLEAKANDTSFLAGWSGGIDSQENPYSLVMDSDYNIIASFEPNTFEVEIEGEGEVDVLLDGSRISLSEKEDFVVGEEIRLDQNEDDDDYYFNYWSGDVAEEDIFKDSIYVEVTRGNTLVKAVFSKIEPITFKNDKLKELIEDNDKFDDSSNCNEGEVCTNQVNEIKSLDEQFENIDNLKGIEHLTGLEELKLLGNDIEDISYLKDLSRLERLGLKGNDVKDISVLLELDNLESVNLEHNNLNDEAEGIIEELKADGVEVDYDEDQFE